MSSATTTHPNFKSLVPFITNAEELEDIVGRALGYQQLFERRTTPFELKYWNYEELQKLEIDTRSIDRLYYVDGEKTSGEESYHFIVRMDYKGTLLYAELISSCTYSGYPAGGEGTIFISRDANLFMKLVLSSSQEPNQDLIYESLAEDGIRAEKAEESYSPFAKLFRSTPPMLKYLCHQEVYLNFNILRPYFSDLPPMLVNSLNDFINTREAAVEYEK